MDRTALEGVKESEAGIGGSGDVARYFVQTPSGPVNITNLHLETPRKGLEGLLDGGLERLAGNTELRTIESRLARRWVDAGTLPTLVMGDFNTPVESRIFQDSWGDFTDAFSQVGFGFGMTKNNGRIRVRIDHVLTGEGWYVDHATVGRDLGSDHLPLIVDLTLAPHQPWRRSSPLRGTVLAVTPLRRQIRPDASSWAGLLPRSRQISVNSGWW
jgi:Endonuclease/Exonuclease/phosphatase family